MALRLLIALTATLMFPVFRQRYKLQGLPRVTMQFVARSRTLLHLCTGALRCVVGGRHRRIGLNGMWQPEGSAPTYLAGTARTKAAITDPSP